MSRHGHGPFVTEKPKNVKKTLVRIFGLLKPYRIRFVIVIAFALLSTIFSIVGPKILGQATTKLYEGLVARITGSGDVDFASIGQILWFLVVIYLASMIFGVVQSAIMSDVSAKVTYRLREDIMAKIDRLPLAYFDTHAYGDVLSYLTNDVETISSNLSSTFTSLITSFVTVIGVLVMMLSISGWMTLAALIVIPLSGVLVALIVRRSQSQFRAQQQVLGKLNGSIEELYGNQLLVKAFNGEDAAIEQFSGQNEALYRSAWKSQFFGGMMQPLMVFVGNIGYVLVCMLGGYLAAIGTIAIGDIQSFIQYVRSFNQPIAQVAQLSGILQSTAAAGERVFALLDEQEELPDTNQPLDPVALRGDVAFAHVHFGYLKDQEIIHDFTTRITAGQKIAIVGPTGAGKTTIVKLLMRFYDVTQGAILVDDLDIRQFRRNDIRRQFGMVLQDTWLYNATIRDNIRYGSPNATDAEVEEVAKMAQVDHFVRTLPQGYETMLNEETTNISQGQKQLLTIARAMLAHPKILILDEATSSVDTRTEVLIQKAMETLMEGRTSFIIAHRLSTIRNADHILVMDHGDIVEQGTHDRLLAADGFYAKLYNAQFTEALD